MAEGRFKTLFYAALLVAFVATYGVYRELRAARTGREVTTRRIVVAATDIPEGVTLDKSMLTMADWPSAAAPAGAFGVLDSVAGRVSRTEMYKGDIVGSSRLAPVGSGPGLEVKIAPGKRAMAVKINDVAGLSGLIQPGSRVDVLVTLRSGRNSDAQVAKLFMENMRVLSVGQKVQRGDDGKPINATSATLEVAPDEAERLAVATNEGSIQLVLRGYGDPASVMTKGASSADVLASLRDAPAVKPTPVRLPVRLRPPVKKAPGPSVTIVTPSPRYTPDSATVRVYKGNQVQQQKFETTQRPDTGKRP